MVMSLFRSTESLGYKRRARDGGHWKGATRPDGGTGPAFVSPYGQKYDSVAVMYQGPAAVHRRGGGERERKLRGLLASLERERTA